METITFYSYKGGTGRTLLVAHTARYLALSGKRVVAVDLDLEAPGLHYRLATDAAISTGVVDYLATSLEQSRAPAAPLADYLLPAAMPDGNDGQLWLLPAGPAPSGDYWKQLTRLLHLAPFLDTGGAGLAAILDLKARIEDELHPDYLLIDARTGITEVGGVATSVLADKVVCLLVDNQESVEGTQAVMGGLRNAQRPARQRPVEVFPVLSRVAGDAGLTRKRVLAALRADGAGTATIPELYVIRDDPRVETDGTDRPRSGPPQGAYRDYRFLLAALAPVGPGGISPAWARHVAVQELVEWLTDSEGRNRRRPSAPNAFQAERIEEGVRVGGRDGRYADVVAFADADHTEPLLAAEYVGDELEASTAWAWWQEHSDLRCVVLFGSTLGGRIGWRVFTRANQRGPFTDREDGWGVQWPVSFAALDDPGDHTIASLVAAVKHGEPVFVPLLVREWQHATYHGLHGGFTPEPRKAQEIVDGFASVRDENSESAVLWHTAPDIERAYAGMDGEEARMEEHTTRELHAPLWWRLSADAKVAYWHGRMRTTAAVQLLASDIMGLVFDPDREFRTHTARLGATGVRLLFRELDFAITDEPPPELVRLAALAPWGSVDLPARNGPGDGRNLAEATLVADATLDRLLRDPGGNPSVVTTNLLGGYDPVGCRVILYRPVAAWCAKAISVDQRALENVVLLHETVHALCHLGLDLDGNRWDEFALPPSTNPTFRPSALHEGLAQYFTFRMLERLADASMTTAFEGLTAVQPPEYQQWRKMRSVPLEKAREALLRARAGLTGFLMSH